MRHFRASLTAPKNGSNDGADFQTIWPAIGQSRAIPKKRLGSRQENRASKIGWLSRSGPPACVNIRSIVDSSQQQAGPTT